MLASAKPKQKTSKGGSDETGQDACSARLIAALVGGQALAQDTLKIAIGQINNWENQPPTLGQDAGIFAKHNLKIEAVGTQGAGETIQAVISGSADLGAGVGVAGVMRAFSKGAPVRILLPAFTGTGDLYWYVKADSPIKIAQGHHRQEHHRLFDQRVLVQQHRPCLRRRNLACKAKPTATGGQPGTLTSVMSGQIDIGWAAPPFGVKELKEGQIRIIARGSDVPSLSGPDRAHDHRQCRCVEDQEGCHPALREGLSRERGLDVFRSQGDRDVRAEDQVG